MPDIKLYNKVRKLLENGLTVLEIHSKLVPLEYRAKDIDSMIEEYYKDESHDYDDKLIKYIKKSLSRGKNILDVYDALAKKGHPPFEINKAIQRVDMGKYSLMDIFKGWALHTYVQVLVTLANLLLSIFYSVWFLIPLIIISIIYLNNSSGLSEKNKKWEPELKVISRFGGLSYQSRFFGFHPLFGRYFKWWKLNPTLVIILTYVIFGTSTTIALANPHFITISVILMFVGIYSVECMPKARY